MSERSRIPSLPTVWGCVIGLVSLVLGCGHSTPCYSTGQLGTCCTEDVECGGYSCLQEFPDGYCSQRCEESHYCPEGSQCIRIDYSGTGSGLTGKICLVECGAGLIPCRDGYKCRLIENTTVQVCFPQ